MKALFDVSSISYGKSTSILNTQSLAEIIVYVSDIIVAGFILFCNPILLPDRFTVSLGHSAWVGQEI